MASYAALTVAGLSTGTSTWANNIRDHVVIQCTSGTRPSSPHEGMLIFETDTDRYMAWNTVAWVFVAATSVAGSIYCQVSSPAAAVFPIPSGSLTALSWTVEDSDLSAMHAPSSGEIVAPYAGCYSCSFSIAWTSFWTRSGDMMRVLKNGGTLLGDVPIETATSFTSGSFGPFYLAANDRVSLSILQNSGSGRTMSSGFFAVAYFGQ